MTAAELQELQQRVKRALEHADAAERYASNAEMGDGTQDAAKARREAASVASELEEIRKILEGLSGDRF
jgi:hypothetical protein